MISIRGSGGLSTRASWTLAALVGVALLGLAACEGAGVGVAYSDGGYYGPYDYDYDYDYGPWGPDYYVGPPVVGGVFVHGRDHDHGHARGPGGGRAGPAPHFRPAPPSRPVPSIPSRARPR